jgi:hypothetical protein
VVQLNKECVILEKESAMELVFEIFKKKIKLKKTEEKNTM